MKRYELLSLLAAAAAVHLHHATLRRAITRGEIQAHRVPHTGKILIERKRLLEWHRATYLPRPVTPASQHRPRAPK